MPELTNCYNISRENGCSDVSFFASLSVPAILLIKLLVIVRNKYRKIPNISPGLINIFKYIWWCLYSGGLIFGGHIMLVSAYSRV